MSTHYTAGSVPLAFMQEDFLVMVKNSDDDFSHFGILPSEFCTFKF